MGFPRQLARYHASLRSALCARGSRPDHREKAGVSSLGAEGFMLVGAMAGVGAVVQFGGRAASRLVAAALAAAAVSLIFALLVIGCASTR